MFLKSVTPTHVVSQTCRAQAACIQECEKVASLAQLARNVKFFVNGEPLETVTEFKYLGRILSADGSDDGAVNMNITKLPRHGSACIEFSVVTQLIIMSWDASI
jgi:hypothetical protein